ncbi:MULTISPECIES: methyltransferase domain-containing protein [unclassified Bradyrhizobium]|uniref:class I SAM-dependent methyltransferase n=1 Tax=unclassified Bradyrhizobium TaxID=2631580 RepID=UPI003399A8FF
MTAEQSALDRKRRRALGDYSVNRRRGLEFGPLGRPIVRRSDAEVLYLDHATTEEIRTKYAGHEVGGELCEIDIVADGRSLSELLGNRVPLDFIVASHVIEHVPDLIGWLSECHDALAVGGRLVLVIPDKRFTFDVCRRESAFEEALQAYRERRHRPGLRCIMDHFANVVQADTYRLWDDYACVPELKFHHGPEFLELAAREFNEGKYIDVHCWVFTPWSFMDLIRRITSEVPHLNFNLAYFLTTQDHDLEFYVQLEKVAAGTTNWAEIKDIAEKTALWPESATPRQRSLSRLGRWLKRH